MKYFSPFMPFVLVGPTRPICTISSGLLIEYSFDLNMVFVFFPCWQCLHKVLVGFVIWGISLTSFLLMTLTRLSKCMCPIILFHSQLSSSFPRKHFSFPTSLNTYMLLEVLATVATNFLESYFLISHFCESKVTLWPWSHIWITLIRLGFISSTSRTFSYFSFFFLIQTVPFPMILVQSSFSKDTDPYISFCNVRNLSLSLFMCFDIHCQHTTTFILLSC